MKPLLYNAPQRGILAAVAINMAAQTNQAVKQDGMEIAVQLGTLQETVQEIMTQEMAAAMEPMNQAVLVQGIMMPVLAMVPVQDLLTIMVLVQELMLGVIAVILIMIIQVVQVIQVIAHGLLVTALIGIMTAQVVQVIRAHGHRL